MKKKYAPFLLSLWSCIFLSYNISAQYAWKQLANFGGTIRQGTFAFSIGNYGYIGSGYCNGTNYSDFWQYNPSTNTWTQKNDVPVAVRAASAFVINGKGYVTGGIDNSSIIISNSWEFDPILNSWTAKANFPGAARYGAAFFSIGTKGYCGIGNSGTANGPYNTDFYEYDPTLDSWTQKADFPSTARYGCFGIAFDSIGYVGFGTNSTMGIDFNDWWEYDPSINSWTAKSSFPGASRAYPSGFTINGTIYVGTGDNLGTSLNDFYEYNPVIDMWIQKQNYGGGYRWTVVGFPIGNIGYFGTGVQNGYRIYYNDFWEYAPLNPPSASFQSSDSIICTNNCINFTDYSTNATSWLWSFTGGTPSSSTDENPQSICYFVSGNYNVTLIASNSNGSDTLTLTSYITVNASPPTPVITQIGDTLSFTPDASDTSYQWFYYSTPIPGETDTSLVAYYNGNYNVKVTNKNGCSVAVGIAVVLGVNELESNPYINLYPNPVSDELTMSISKPFHKTNITIDDVFGRRLLDKTFDLSTNNELILNFDGYSAGTYFVTVNIEGNSFIKKVLKLN